MMFFPFKVKATSEINVFEQTILPRSAKNKKKTTNKKELEQKVTLLTFNRKPYAVFSRYNKILKSKRSFPQ